MKENNRQEPDQDRSQTSETSSSPRLRVGITHGDFNGVGYEVILKMLDDPRILELCTPVVYGSAKIAAYYRKGLELAFNIPFNQIQQASQARTDAVNIVNVIGQEAHIAPGESTPEAGEAAFIALERAVADLKEGTIDVLLTAPINKANIQSDTFRFAGHTEYLASACGDGAEPLMILFNDRIRVALVTTHLPLAKIAEAITEDAIVAKLQLFNQSLTADFAIVKPRIAVLSLNPHAGDGGLLGAEEKEIIAPAIERARNQLKIHAFGPYPADGFFGNGLYTKFDGVLAMYHDQGLAPFKTLAMESGVNFTAGLPYVRTSPDHGTGYDIAGKGVASEASMRAALYAAIDIFRSRRTHEEMTASPLPKLYHERGRDNVVLDLTKDR
ncbi:MAG: 4-hydroxythreonine-4-phosphate dehydrogenase PdxA [bacterium]|jgi:4-hydroxythreonine-4-phosphate dehydrogenase|nr:4-hydroxythreonine-4-phosphate dehydrogenase PdxA [bacterium]